MAPLELLHHCEFRFSQFIPYEKQMLEVISGASVSLCPVPRPYHCEGRLGIFVHVPVINGILRQILKPPNAKFVNLERVLLYLLL